MNFPKGEPIQLRSREKWRGEAEVSSLAPNKGSTADTTQGFSHQAQVLLPTPLSSGTKGGRSPPTAGRREDHSRQQKGKEPGPGDKRWEAERERSWPKSAVVPAPGNGLQLSDMLGRGASCWGCLQQLPPLPPNDKPSLVHLKPLGEFQEAGLLLSLSGGSRAATVAQQPGQAAEQ